MKKENLKRGHMLLRDLNYTKKISVTLKTACAIFYNSLICTLFLSPQTLNVIKIISPQVKEEMV